MTWPTVKLDTVISFIRGITFKPDDQVEPLSDGSVVVMRTKNVQVAGLDTDDVIAVPNSFVKREELYLQEGDLLISSANSWELVGKCSYVGNLEYSATAGGFISILRANKTKLDSRYFYHWLSQPVIQHAVRHCGRQTTNISNLDVGRFKDLEIPLPPLAEQQRIAAILDKADAIRRKRQQAIQLADDFLRAVFLDMFGDPVTNPKGWPTMRVEEICTIVRGSSPRPQGDPRYYGGPVPRLMVADLTRDGKRVTPSIDSLTEEGAKKSRPIKAGTVVMAVSGNVGLTSVLAINACIHDGFIAFKELDESKVKAAFLCELMMFLKSTHASRQAGAIFQNLTTSQIKEMDIPIPPTSLQDKFLEICVKGDQLYGQETPGLFESLSQKAFRGEL